MPQRRSGIKELRKNHAHRMHNLDIKTELKKTLKTFQETVAAKKKSDAQTQLKVVYKKLDKAAKRNIIHSNTAARRKARFAKLLASIA